LDFEAIVGDVPLEVLHFFAEKVESERPGRAGLAWLPSPVDSGIAESSAGDQS
jgi:hypothetical protein